MATTRTEVVNHVAPVVASGVESNRSKRKRHCFRGVNLKRSFSFCSMMFCDFIQASVETNVKAKGRAKQKKEQSKRAITGETK
jgi:hypothetical protein